MPEKEVGTYNIPLHVFEPSSNKEYCLAIWRSNGVGCGYPEGWDCHSAEGERLAVDTVPVTATSTGATNVKAVVNCAAVTK